MLKTFLKASALAGLAHAVAFTVQTSGNATAPTQYGIMFEDINNSGDGGIYSELVQNRAFQDNEIFPRNLDWWHPIGGVHLSLKRLPNPLSDALPVSMRVANGTEETIGFWNEGYWGFPIVADWQYNGSFYIHGVFDGAINVALVSNTTKNTYAKASVKVTSQNHTWTQCHYTFQPTSDAPDSNNTLRFTMPASAVKSPLNFNLLSLFPPTYNGRPNGNRIDLMDAMAGMKPSLFRLPGGNNLEGNQPPFWWDWKKTIGPLEDRPGFPGTWGYQNTDGLGLVEYMLWAQDLGVEPILGLWAGLYLNGTILSKSALQPYVDDALDELEFLMGDVSTPWGEKRAALGHPNPWPIRFVEIGNEDSLTIGGPSYRAYRFDMFYSAIKAKYPNTIVLASFYDVGPVTPTHGASGDFHEYAFDNYTSENPLFVGEYAVTSYDIPGFGGPQYFPGAPRARYPFWYGSVAEAIFLLSAERNADKIIGAAYAPGFMNYNRWEWVPDLIQYDANPANTVRSTSWAVISLLSGTRITETLPTVGGAYGPAFWVAGRSVETGSHIVKAVVYNSTTQMVPFNVTFAQVPAGAMATLTYLTAPMNASNTIGKDVVKTSVTKLVADQKAVFRFEMPRWSVGFLEVDAKSSGFGEMGSRKGWKGWADWAGGKGYSGKWNQWGQGWPNL